MQRREKKAFEEVQSGFDKWLINGETDLGTLLKYHFRITNDVIQTRVLNRLAGLREPRNEEEILIDQELAQGKQVHVDDVDEKLILKDFSRCREVFYMQRAQILAAVEDLLAAENDPSDGGFEKFEKLCPGVFLEPHHSIIADKLGFPRTSATSDIPNPPRTASSKKRRKTKGSTQEGDSESNESNSRRQAFRWFADTLEKPLLYRDYELAYLHLTQGRKLTTELLGQAFAMVGLPRPQSSDLDRMLKDVNTGDNFDDLYDFVDAYTSG